MTMTGINKIQFPLGLLPLGSIIKLQFPFQDDPSKYKERPAVIVQVSKNAVEVVMLKVTTHTNRGGYDYTVGDHKAANLKAGSVVRCDHVLVLSGQYRC